MWFVRMREHSRRESTYPYMVRTLMVASSFSSLALMELFVDQTWLEARSNPASSLVRLSSSTACCVFERVVPSLRLIVTVVRGARSLALLVRAP